MAKARVLLIGFDGYSLGARTLCSLMQAHGVHAELLIVSCYKMVRTDDPSFIATRPTMADKTATWLTCDMLELSDSDLDEIRRYVDDNQYDIVGVSSLTNTAEVGIQILEALKQSKAITISGGVGVTVDPLAFGKHSDFLCLSYGESPMLEAALNIDALKNGSVGGLLQYKNGRFVGNEKAKYIDLTKSYSIYQGSKCFENGSVFDCRKIYDESDFYPALAARGCYNKCTYCNANSLRSIYLKNKQPPFFALDSETIFKDLEAAKATGYTVIWFVNDYFIGSSQELISFFKEYKKRIGLPFFAQLSTRQVLKNNDILFSAIDAGFMQTTIGVQNGVEAFRKGVYRRSESDEDILEYSSMLHENKINKQYNLIVGCYQETEEMVKESVKFLTQVPFDPIKDESVAFHYVDLPKTQLTELKPQQPVYKHDTKALMVASMTATYAPMLSEREVESLFTSPLFRENPTHLRSLRHDFVYRSARDNKISITNSALVKPMFKRYLSEHPTHHVVVWGTSQNYQLMKNVFEEHPISFFVDNDQSKWGCIQDGAEIKSPDSLVGLDKVIVYICSVYRSEIKEQILKLNPLAIIP